MLSESHIYKRNLLRLQISQKTFTYESQKDFRI